MHSHSHHSHSQVASKKMTMILVISIALNLVFVCVEAGVGIWQNSLSLLSDAGHNLSDVFSLILVLVGIGLSHLHSNQRFTYGYKKSTILISLLNAIILLVAVGVIIAESIHKFRAPSAVDGAAISWTAGAGIIVNGITTILLMRGSKQDLNVRGAFLHMAADTLVSIGVVLSGVIITITGLYIIDPIISIIIAIVILVTTWELLTDSLRLAMDGIPEGVNIEDIKSIISSVEHIKGVHHIHIWSISTTENALTAHIVLDDLNTADEVKQIIRNRLQENNINHITLETETLDTCCTDTDCC